MLGSFNALKYYDTSLLTLPIVLLFYFAAISSFSEVDARFRLPIMPFWIIIASYGLEKSIIFNKMINKCYKIGIIPLFK